MSAGPVLIDAARAHRSGEVTYADDGTATVRGERVPPSRQFPAIRATFDDLNKALSSLATSPRLEDGRTLRERYDAEVARYDALVSAAVAEGRLEPDYGTYALDEGRGDLYLVAPERWHRLALVTSNSHLLVDPEGRLSWTEVRARLEGAVVGFLGVSVGGNLLEGWLREARPRRVKIADPDQVELTNLNRGERLSLRHVAGSRAARFDPRDPYDQPRISKAEAAAYEARLVDPYLQVDLYGDGIHRGNLDQFLLGDGGDEPPVDLVVEEMDDLELKVLVRQRARELRLDVVMLSDFGHRAHLLWNPFRSEPDGPLGCGASDDQLLDRLAASRSGDRSDVFRFVAALCGDDFAGDPSFSAWMAGRGEHPTASLPQSGATAMASGAIGGKEIALHLLGHPVPPGDRAVYDLLNRRVT